MAEGEKKQSFWTTLPGVLTGIAAVITALASLYTAWNTIGGDQSAETLGQVKQGTEGVQDIRSIEKTTTDNAANASTSSNTGYNENVELELERGRKFRDAQDDIHAIEAFKNAIAQDPSSATAFEELGRTYHLLYSRKHDAPSALAYLDDAIKNYLKAVELSPSWATPLANLGSALIGKKDYSTSLTYLKRAVGINPISDYNQYHLALAYFHTGDYVSAIRHFDKTISLQEASDARYWRGICHRIEGNTSLAAADFQWVVEKNDSPELVQKASLALRDLGY